MLFSTKPLRVSIRLTSFSNGIPKVNFKASRAMATKRSALFSSLLI